MRAAAAPPDPAWLCNACGAETAEWSALCPACGAFATIDWTAPERAAPAALGREEAAPAAALPAAAPAPPEGQTPAGPTQAAVSPPAIDAPSRGA